MAKMTETQRASYKAEAALGAALVADLRAQGAAEYEFHERHGDIYGAQTERLLGFHSEEDAVIQCVPLHDPARGLTTRTFAEIKLVAPGGVRVLYQHRGRGRRARPRRAGSRRRLGCGSL